MAPPPAATPAVRRTSGTARARSTSLRPAQRLRARQSAQTPDVQGLCTRIASIWASAPTSTILDLDLMSHSKPALAYQLIREALLAGGPVPAAMMADGPFMAYSSGVYTHSCDMSPNHAVTAIGWEPDSWICLNFSRKWRCFLKSPLFLAALNPSPSSPSMI